MEEEEEEEKEIAHFGRGGPAVLLIWFLVIVFALLIQFLIPLQLSFSQKMFA